MKNMTHDIEMGKTSTLKDREIENKKVKWVLRRLESEKAELSSMIEFLKNQDPEKNIDDLIDEDVKESLYEYLYL